MSSGYYPLGAEDDSCAPFNDKERIGIVKCTAKAYYNVEREVDLETETTIVYRGFSESYDVPQSEWEDIYSAECLSPVDLIRELASVIKKHVDSKCLSEDESKRINNLIDEADGWSCEELDLEILNEYL